MTPKEKAKELVIKKYGCSKRYALIAVDEIMKAPFENSYLELVPDDAPDSDWFWDKFDEYWNEVKNEIKKL